MIRILVNVLLVNNVLKDYDYLKKEIKNLLNFLMYL